MSRPPIPSTIPSRPGRPRAPCHFCQGPRDDSLPMALDAGTLVPSCSPCKAERTHLRRTGGRRATPCELCGADRTGAAKVMKNQRRMLLVCAACWEKHREAVLALRGPKPKATWAKWGLLDVNVTGLDLRREKITTWVEIQPNIKRRLRIPVNELRIVPTAPEGAEVGPSSS